MFIIFVSVNLVFFLPNINTMKITVFVLHTAIGNLRRRQFYSEPLDNGRILLQGSYFTYQDVLDELIVYIPEGETAHSDEFRFSLSDGRYTESGRLQFNIEPQRKASPRMAVNRGLQISAGISTFFQILYTDNNFYRILSNFIWGGKSNTF